jgi:mannosyltransferase OCH1-like enzyme
MSIPRILHRTVPEQTSDEVERWWVQLQELHPGWEAHTWREPINPDDFPLVGRLLDACQTGAQRADLIRLEVLYLWGGFYVDSDCEPLRSFDSLLPLHAVAAWEDESTIPNAVMGAEAGNAAIFDALSLTISRNVEGLDTWHCGAGTTTDVFRDHPAITLLPPGAFYPYHYLEKRKRSEVTSETCPWTFVVHHWHHSWGTPAERRSLARNQR